MSLFDTRKTVVAVKYGGTASGTDAIAISNEDVRLSPETATGSFRCINGMLGNKTSWLNSDDTSVNGATIECYLTGNDGTGLALTTAPDWADVYKICAMTETVGASGIAYTPSQTQPSDASTVAIWRDGRKRVLTGALGTLTITGTVGEPVRQSVAVSGFTTITSTAEANPTAACVDDELLLVLKSIDTFAIGASSIKAQSFTLTQGNDNQKLYFMGLKDYERVDFDSMLEVTYLKENEDIYTIFAAGTESSVVITIGATDGKAVKITCGQAVVETVTETSIQNKEAYTVRFNLKGNGSGVEQFKLEWGDVIA